ncbi:MAG TPA: response regulator [Bryobacteraceae bacterium]|jgi:CheY-like chemotaxis protein|nr:response regulator [Bryobacteraceae bacterium]
MSDSILVVDDNADNLELTQILLECEGFEVRRAEDAAQALFVLATYHPKLILMDVQLPGMDGLELTRRLRQDSSFDDTLIVALSAYAMAPEKENARAAGCDGYITKPIDTRTFGTEVRQYLNSLARAPLVDSRSSE